MIQQPRFRFQNLITLWTAGERQIEVQSADIAPGGPDTTRFDGDDGPFSAPSVFGYERRISDHIKRGAEIYRRQRCWM